MSDRGSKMRWWLILSVTLLWSTATPHPVNNDNVADQSTNPKCCPCPEDVLGSAGPLDQAAAGSASEARTAGLECPSQFRAADSAGAPSILFPHTLFSDSRRARPVATLEDEKEAVQPLLKPEVDLASSVVNTLRESTDEDYREALERDAARSAARAFKSEGEKAVKNLINVFVDPKQAVGKDNDSKNTDDTNPTKLFSDILKLALPKPESIKKLFDKDSSAGASNINEQRVAATNRNDGVKMMSKLDPLNLFSEDSPLRKTHINFFKEGDISKNSKKDEGMNTGLTRSAIDTISGSKLLVLPNIANLFSKTDLRKSVQNDDKNQFKESVQNAGKFINGDTHFSPSNVNERYSIDKGTNEKNNNDDGNKHNFNKLSHEQSNVGERATHKLQQNTPKSKMTSINRDAASDLLRDVFKGLESSRNLWNIPGIFNLGKNVPNEKVNNNNKKFEDTIKPQGTEIIEVADANDINSLRDINKLSNGNSFIENGNEQISEKNPIHFNKNFPNKDYANTRIITHIPTGNSEESSDIESVNDIEQINEVNDSDEMEGSSTNIDTPANLSLFPGASDNTEFGNINTDEYPQPLLMPQVKSTGRSANGDRKASNLFKGFEKLRAPARHPLFTPQNNKLRKNYEDGSKHVSMNDLQQMSDSLLGEATSRNIPLFQKKNVDGSNAKSNKMQVLNAADAKTSIKNGKQITLDKNDCPSHKASGKGANDMTSEASENIPNIFDNFGAPQIVQPFSLFEDMENPLDRLNENLADIFNNPLPTPLLPNMLSGDDFLSNLDQGLSVLPSTSDFNSALSTLPTLEDLNLSNLNLELPRPIDLTPLNLGRSSMGNVKAADLFSSPITLPDIDDISGSLLENVHNLLTPPLESSRNVLEDTLKSGQELSDNIREHARSAVNNFHKNIGHSLKDVGLSEIPNLENPLVSGANMLEDLRARHEDFGDKIKGLHYDLSDRLETIRNNILDHLPDLDPSMIAESSNVKVMREPFAQNLPRLSSEHANLMKRLSSSGILSPNANDRRKLSGPHLLSKSATPLLAAFPKSYSRPLYVKSNNAAKSPFAQTSPVMKRKNNSIVSNRKPYSKSSPRDSLVRINKPTLRAKSTKSKTLNRPRLSKLNSSTLNKPMRDAYAFKSTNAAVKSPFSGKTKPYGNRDILKSASPAQLPNILWPKLDETLITKVRDAVKDRLSSLTPNRDVADPILGMKSDMDKSASRNVETVEISPDLMKENIPYSCKMVCAKL